MERSFAPGHSVTRDRAYCRSNSAKHARAKIAQLENDLVILRKQLAQAKRRPVSPKSPSASALARVPARARASVPVPVPARL